MARERSASSAPPAGSGRSRARVDRRRRAPRGAPRGRRRPLCPPGAARARCPTRRRPARRPSWRRHIAARRYHAREPRAALALMASRGCAAPRFREQRYALRHALTCARLPAAPRLRGSVAAVVARRGASRLAGGCSPNAVCKLGGPINDPSNYTLRRSIMSFGLGQFCQQMTKHNAPLKLTPDANVIGRFFPQHCTQQTLAERRPLGPVRRLRLRVDGPVEEVTFTSAATIQYDQDFKCADDNVDLRVLRHAHGLGAATSASRRSSSPSRTSCRTGSPRSPTPSASRWCPASSRRASPSSRTRRERRLRASATCRSGSGRSPVRRARRRPRHATRTCGREVHTGERDFIGPITVDGSGRAIFMQMHLDGSAGGRRVRHPEGGGGCLAPALLQLRRRGPARVPAALRRTSSQAGVEYQRAVPLPAGLYYVVIDNTPAAGKPPRPPRLRRRRGHAAVVNYSIQIGDAP